VYTVKCYRIPKEQSEMDNQEKLTTLSTQNTGRRQATKQKQKQNNTNKKP